MPEQLLKVVQPIKTRWDALTRPQKIKLIAAILVVLLALVVTVYFTVRTKYVPFVNNLDGNNYVQIQSALLNAGIKSKPANNNTTIMVDEKRLGDAKVEMDTNPTINTVPFTFADALTASGMSATESVKREAFIKAKQYELSEAIKGFSGVLSANVQLSIPEHIRFVTSSQEKSTASVRVETSRDLTRNEGANMARFLCRSVEGLEMENIEIYDNNFVTLYSGSQDTASAGVGSIAELQEQERNLVTKLVRNQFQPMFNEVQVAPNLVYDNNVSTQSHVTTVAPPVSGSETGVPIEDHTSSQTVSGSPTADEPGLAANDQTTATYDTGNGTTYKATDKQSDTTYDYNRSEIISQTGPGQYLRKDSTIAVSLFRYIPYYQENMIKKDKTFSQSDWDDFKTTTTEHAVTDDPNLELYKEHVASASGIDKNNVIVTVWEVPIFFDYTKTPIEIQQIIMFAVLALLILMLAYGLIRRTKPDEEEEEVEPELSVEDLLVSTQLEEAKQEAVGDKLDAIDYFQDSEVKRQIEKFVNEKPDAVAQLLRNWLNNEDW